MTTDNFRKHTSKNPLQRFLIERFFDALMKEAGKLNADSVLDVGCGEGFTLKRFQKAHLGGKLEGVEFSPRALAIGRRFHPDLLLREGSIYQLPYEDGSFDMVLCAEVLEHLEDPEKALTELYRVTRKYVIITVPNEPFFRIANFLRGKNISRFGNDREHINHWSKGSIARLVGRYFKVQAVKSPFPWTIVVGNK